MTDRAAVRVPPPLIYALVMAVGFLLRRHLWPLEIPTAGVVRTAAWATLVAGGVLVLGPFLQLVRSGQNPEPWKPTPSIVAAGYYRFSRNPMYVGMALLQAGAGLWTGVGWWSLLVPLSLYAVYRLAVRHEETYLEAKFGDRYLDYKGAVRRWI